MARLDPERNHGAGRAAHLVGVGSPVGCLPSVAFPDVISGVFTVEVTVPQDLEWNSLYRQFRPPSSLGTWG